MQGPPPQYRGSNTRRRPGAYAAVSIRRRSIRPQNYIPPALQAGFHTYGEYAALRGYEAQELAIRRGDPIWSWAYGRAAMQSDSGITLGSEANWFHGGDRMIATDATGKVSFLNGIALVGDAKWTDVQRRQCAPGQRHHRAHPDQGHRHRRCRSLPSSWAATAKCGWKALMGNNVAGGRLEMYTGSPTGFGFIKFDYHNPDVDTPTAVAFQAQTDKGVIGYGGMLGWGLWGSLSGGATRYGVHGDSDVARTAGWDANLRWQTDLYNGLLAGISYDGHGEYRIDNDSRTAPPATGRAFRAAGHPQHGKPCRHRHPVLDLLRPGSGSTPMPAMWSTAMPPTGCWPGLDLHYTPAPGVDIALGARQSAVSFVQGETGRQTTAGLNVTLGFGAPPQPSWMANQL